MSTSEEELGRRLRLMADDVAVGPAPQWPQVHSGLRRAARRRRSRRVGGALAVAAGLVGAITAIHPGLLAQLSQAARSSAEVGAVTPADKERPSRLSQGPTKGPLASDGVWLDALRQAVADRPVVDEDGRRWSADPGDIDVVYAGDVADERLAAIEATYRSGGDVARVQAWLVGARGAAATELQSTGWVGDAAEVTGSPSNAGEVMVHTGADERTVLLVTSATDPVTLTGQVDYAADGTPAQTTQRVAALEAGVYLVRPAAARLASAWLVGPAGFVHHIPPTPRETDPPPGGGPARHPGAGDPRCGRDRLRRPGRGPVRDRSRDRHRVGGGDRRC